MSPLWEKSKKDYNKKEIIYKYGIGLMKFQSALAEIFWRKARWHHPYLQKKLIPTGLFKDSPCFYRGVLGEYARKAHL